MGSDDHVKLATATEGFVWRLAIPILILLLSGTCSMIVSVVSTWSATADQVQQIEALRPLAKDVSSPLPRKRRTFTVFNTGCSPGQDWQSQGLLYSHDTRNIEGELVRLMSCKDVNYTIPRYSYEKYRVFRTPDFDTFHADDPYSPRNKANGMSYWLSGRSDDPDLPEDDDVIVLIDPDMIFLPQRFDFSNIKAGVGEAALYGLGKQWVKDWALPFCNGTCDAVDKDDEFSYGVPIILTAGDARRHAPLWADVTEMMRKDKKGPAYGWMTEMFSCVIAARRLGIRLDVTSTMVSNPEMDDEPWAELSWHAPPSSPVKNIWAAHYCQEYQIGDFSWYKHDFRHIDIRQCDRTMNFPPPDSETMVAMQHARDGPLIFSQGNGDAREKVQRSRNVWLLDNTAEQVRRAISAYYEEFC